MPLNLTTATGIPVTQGGVLVYGTPTGNGNSKNTDLNYQVTAPFGSFNFAKGKMGFTLPGAELIPPEPPAAVGAYRRTRASGAGSSTPLP